MARSLRLEYPGAWWHVTNRGVERRDIFLDEEDRRRFMKIVANAVAKFRWRLHAYVLMTNHYHLLIETILPTLSRGMQKIGGDHAEAFNLRHQRVGHLFQGRFKSHLIDSESYLLTVARYIVMNPVRAGMVTAASDWEWSSYRATAGLAEVPSWLTVTSVRECLSRNPSLAKHLYRGFVEASAADATSPWDNLVGQIYLGDEDFIDRVQQRIDDQQRSSEHPRAQRHVRFATLEDIEGAISETSGQTVEKDAPLAVRLAYAYLARAEALAPLHTIGAKLGLSVTGASYLARRAETLMMSDGELAELIERARRSLRHCKLQM